MRWIPRQGLPGCPAQLNHTVTYAPLRTCNYLPFMQSHAITFNATQAEELRASAQHEVRRRVVGVFKLQQELAHARDEVEQLRQLIQRMAG